MHTHLAKLYNQLDEDADMSSVHRVLEAVQSSLHPTSQPSADLSNINTTWLQSDLLCLEGFHGSAIRAWLEKYKGRELRLHVYS